MYVHVYSGLTSRCRTLAHAYYLMKNGKGGEELTIVWPLESGCGIHFYEAFAGDIFDDIKIKVIEYVDTIDIISDYLKQNNSTKSIRYFIIRVRDKLLRMYLSYLKNGKKYIDYTPPVNIGWAGKKYVEYEDNCWVRVKRELQNHAKIYIRAYNGIIRGKEQQTVNYSSIKFKEKYWEKVNHILPKVGSCVGVHIRRTDHDVAIKESSTGAFIKEIDRILENKPDTRFFLATDDINEEKYLKSIYKDKIIVQEQKEWGRTNCREMESGIIDFLCLSRCDYILGSHTSVFSHFAAQYGGKELFICRSEENVSN